jgi:ABC-type bacteriocin/lantibiotic exporter with double-glycine peptidase domain
VRHVAPVLLATLLGGCYLGRSEPFVPSSFAGEPGWRAITQVPVIRQVGERDCGAAAAAMLLAFWGLPTSPTEVRASGGVPAEHGLRADFLRWYLRERGLQAFLLEGTLQDLARELDAGRPVLVGVVKPYADQNYAHYQIVVGLNRARQRLVVIDPADGWRVYPFSVFAREWEPARHLMIAVFSSSGS